MGKSTNSSTFPRVGPLHDVRRQKQRGVWRAKMKDVGWVHRHTPGNKMEHFVLTAMTVVDGGCDAGDILRQSATSQRRIRGHYREFQKDTHGHVVNGVDFNS